MSNWTKCLALGLAIFSLAGCSGGGDVTAEGAEASYKNQEKKAEALAQQRGETIEKPTSQGE